MPLFQGQIFQPWPWRRIPSSLPYTAEAANRNGWVSIHLVRVARRRLGAKSRLYPPATLTPFLNIPPRVYLQAVNRSSTF